MNGPGNPDIARRAFRRIQARFPALEMIHNEATPVELDMDIPLQPGLEHAVNINLQNSDELHFSVGHFWLEWFPCSEPSVVEHFIDAVTGFLSGDYHVLEHYRGCRCVRAELQAPGDGGGWQTIGTWSRPWFPWPPRKRYREIRNRVEMENQGI